MKKLDVLFVHPNGAPIIYQELSKTYSAIEPPIWAALLTNNARLNGWSAEILDCEAERLNAAETADTINTFKPRLVAIVIYGQQPSASTQNMAGTNALLRELKAHYGHFKTVLIGLHPSAVSRQTLGDEQTDFVCQGEGPHTINALLSIDMEDTSQLSTVPGLWYYENTRGAFSRIARNGVGFIANGQISNF